MSRSVPHQGLRALPFLVAAWCVHCESPLSGAAVKIGSNVYAELAVEGMSAFRISVSYAGKPQQTKSRMVPEKTVSAKSVTDFNGESVTIKAAFGAAQLGNSGEFELRDAAGKVLIKSTLLSSFKKDLYHETLTLSLGIPPTGTGAPRKYFGAGYQPGAPLTANHSDPSVGNDYGKGAWSWAPQYYSPEDGYAALVVGTRTLPKVDPDDFRCVGDTTGRLECGYYGITNDTCVAKGCCWGPNNLSLPWCYSKTGPSLSGYPASWRSQDDAVVWSVEGPAADIYLMPASDVYAFRRSHAELTGKPGMIPRYAFGFMAGRWGWQDRADIEEKLGRFRNESFPIDAFISDFEWFTDANDYGLGVNGSATYTDFGYDKRTFPEPRKQLAKYHSMGFKFGGIRKPRLGNTDYLAFARSRGWLVKGGVDGKDRNMNYSIAEARQWYTQKNAHYLVDGVDFWWNDEGEVYFFMFDEWNDALFSGFQAERQDGDKPRRRYFSLNRAYTPGMQRYGLSAWTGDIAVSWESLAEQPANMLNLNLMGMPYVGCDTGGFKGGNASPELLTRWYQVASFMSIMRVHSNNQQIPHFPFLYGEAAGKAMRKALELRYQMLPLWYSLGHQAFADGAPITRPLLMEFPFDANVATLTDQWLVGSGIMVAPVMAAGGKRDVYFPDGATWYGFNTSTQRSGREALSVPLDAVPVYCRAGAVLPLAPKIQHTGQLPGGPLEVQVYHGANGSFTMVEDDGETVAYEKGATRRTTFQWTDISRTLSWKVEGSFVDQHVFRYVKAVLFTPTGTLHSPQAVKLGESGSISFDDSPTVI